MFMLQEVPENMGSHSGSWLSAKEKEKENVERSITQNETYNTERTVLYPYHNAPSM